MLGPGPPPVPPLTPPVETGVAGWPPPGMPGPAVEPVRGAEGTPGEGDGIAVGEVGVFTGLAGAGTVGLFGGVATGSGPGSTVTGVSLLFGVAGASWGSSAVAIPSGCRDGPASPMVPGSAVDAVRVFRMPWMRGAGPFWLLGCAGGGGASGARVRPSSVLPT